MLIAGLTGSIGMGKSAVAAYFRARDIPVFDADAAVHDIYRKEAIVPIERAFPGTTGPEGVDRQALSKRLLADPAGYRTLEKIVHPLVQEAERKFLRHCLAEGRKLAVLEIPLLFETSGDRRVDVTIVVSAKAEQQKQRVLARPGMTEEKFAQIVARQMPDAEKRRLADYVVDTSTTLEETHRRIDEIIEMLPYGSASAFDRFWN